MATMTDKTPTAVKTKTRFDLSFDGVLSQTWGDIVPIVCQEMVPGDTFNCNATTFVRLAPLASPTYGRMHGYINYFFVPNRILMKDGAWADFMRGGVSGNESYQLPNLGCDDFYNLYQSILHSDDVYNSKKAKLIDKLCTYLRLMPASKMNPSGGFLLNLLPFQAYQRIYGDYYFPWSVEDDADAETFLFRKLDFGYFNGNDTDKFNLLRLRRACFKKDYLTSALTRPQRGSLMYAPTYSYSNLTRSGGTIVDPDNDNITPASTGASGVSSLAIRWANSIQRYLERKNIAGARYFEQILARFGVKISDEALQRSQYLGGHDFYINVSDVTSTAQTDSATLGELAGKGVGLGDGSVSFTNNSDDYGFFFALFHLMPESGVVQGIPRMFTRRDPLHFFTPEMEDTGLQPIYMPEVWQDYFLADGSLGFDSLTNLEDAPVFGYIPRYAEYKYNPPLLGGDFRIANNVIHLSDMDTMHLYRIFSDDNIGGADEDRPTLTSDWLTLDVDKDFEFDRIFQDTNSDFDHFWTNIQVNLQAYRPMVGYAEGGQTFTHDDKGRLVNLPLGGVRL